MGEALSHQLDVYGVWVHLATDRKQWKTLRKSSNLDLGKPESLGLTVRDHRTNGDVHFAVFIDRKALGEAGLVEIVAHEAAHLAGMLFDTIEAPYSGESEPFAYLVGWTTAWLWSGCQ
jgi:hypothetical protein